MILLWAIFFLRLVVGVARAEETQNGLYTASQAAVPAKIIVSQ
jgi:hypothetical protein